MLDLWDPQPQVTTQHCRVRKQHQHACWCYEPGISGQSGQATCTAESAELVGAVIINTHGAAAAVLSTTCTLCSITIIIALLFLVTRWVHVTSPRAVLVAQLAARQQVATCVLP